MSKLRKFQLVIGAMKEITQLLNREWLGRGRQLGSGGQKKPLLLATISK